MTDKNLGPRRRRILQAIGAVSVSSLGMRSVEGSSSGADRTIEFSELNDREKAVFLENLKNENETPYKYDSFPEVFLKYLAVEYKGDNYRVNLHSIGRSTHVVALSDRKKVQSNIEEYDELSKKGKNIIEQVINEGRTSIEESGQGGLPEALVSADAIKKDESQYPIINYIEDRKQFQLYPFKIKD